MIDIMEKPTWQWSSKHVNPRSTSTRASNAGAKVLKQTLLPRSLWEPAPRREQPVLLVQRGWLRALTVSSTGFLDEVAHAVGFVPVLVRGLDV